MEMRVSYCLLVTLLLCGCGGGDDGPGYVPVSGVVTLDGNGVEGAIVTFTPEAGSGNTGTMSMGLTDSNGNFTLRTGTGKVGAAIGKHKVSVELSVAPEPTPEQTTADGLAPALPSELGVDPPKKAAAPKTLYLIPKKYSDPNSSGLTATVEKGGLKDHKIELTVK